MVAESEGLLPTADLDPTTSRCISYVESELDDPTTDPTTSRCITYLEHKLDPSTLPAQPLAQPPAQPLNDTTVAALTPVSEARDYAEEMVATEFELETETTHAEQVKLLEQAWAQQAEEPQAAAARVKQLKHGGMAAKFARRVEEQRAHDAAAAEHDSRRRAATHPKLARIGWARVSAGRCGFGNGACAYG